MREEAAASARPPYTCYRLSPRTGAERQKTRLQLFNTPPLPTFDLRTRKMYRKASSPVFERAHVCMHSICITYITYIQPRSHPAPDLHRCMIRATHKKSHSGAKGACGGRTERAPNPIPAKSPNFLPSRNCYRLLRCLSMSHARPGVYTPCHLLLRERVPGSSASLILFGNRLGVGAKSGCMSSRAKETQFKERIKRRWGGCNKTWFAFSPFEGHPFVTELRHFPMALKSNKRHEMEIFFLSSSNWF